MCPCMYVQPSSKRTHATTAIDQIHFRWWCVFYLYFCFVIYFSIQQTGSIVTISINHPLCFQTILIISDFSKHFMENVNWKNSFRSIFFREAYFLFAKPTKRMFEILKGNYLKFFGRIDLSNVFIWTAPQ